jgi:hypothetical protein
VTRYAQFDHLVTPPCPVIGWYDTGVVTYPSLPPGYDLIEITDNDFWDNRFADGKSWGVQDNAFVDITGPPPDGPTQLQIDASAALGAGIQLTSIATPLLDGSYAVDAGTVSRINGIIGNIAGGLGLPGGDTTFLWNDTSNVGHSFTETDFKHFAAAIMNYTYPLSRILDGEILSLPDPNLTIA